jgi:hypothetical protein
LRAVVIIYCPTFHRDSRVEYPDRRATAYTDEDERIRHDKLKDIFNPGGPSDST